MILIDRLSEYYEDMHFLHRCFRYWCRTERLQIRTLLQLNLNGALAIDIGANKGIYCFWMQRAVGPTGRVIAFEPQPEMRDAITRLKRRFGWPRRREHGSL